MIQYPAGTFPLTPSPLPRERGARGTRAGEGKSKTLYTFTPFKILYAMTEEKSLNFLEEIVENDLKEGKDKSIITRFPPEPNGYLHIGHCKSICLNFGLALKYGGKTNMRLDDTNPVTEETEYVDNIMSV